MRPVRPTYVSSASPLIALAMLVLTLQATGFAQSPAICGTVQDSSGAVVSGAAVQLSRSRTVLDAKTDAAGGFCFHDLQPGDYGVIAHAYGFRETRQAITLHPEEKFRTTILLSVAASDQQVTVVEGVADVGSLNVAQTEIGAGLIHNLPSESVNAALSSILTLATPGVAADSNGVFHPLGEHAETSFSVDGQPISDQQSRIFSNQISANTIQEMQTLQGAPPAEFGDKTSLIVEANHALGIELGKGEWKRFFRVRLLRNSHRECCAGLRLKDVGELSGIGWTR